MQLVYSEDYGIKGINYYWVRHEMYQITLDELRAIDVVDKRAQVNAEIIPALQQANAALKIHGYELFIKDGYRSRKLYQLIFEKRAQQFGEAMTHRILNMVDRPHADGRTVDVTLLDLKTQEELPMRNKEDGVDAFFLNYYREKSDEQSQTYQRLQDLLGQAMLKAGFEYGSKREFWHFTLPNAKAS